MNGSLKAKLYKCVQLLNVVHCKFLKFNLTINKCIKFTVNAVSQIISYFLFSGKEVCDERNFQTGARFMITSLVSARTLIPQYFYTHLSEAARPDMSEQRLNIHAR